MKKTRFNQLGAWGIRRWPSFFVIGILLIGLFAAGRPVGATVTPTVTSLITQAAVVKASSNPALGVFKIVIAVDAGETLTAVTVAATDTGATGFNPATDLAALDATTEALSGVALYNDAGATVGSFDGTDVVVPMNTESAWSGGATTLTLTTGGAAGTYFLVYRTAAAAVNGHSFVFTLPANGVATSLNSPTITPVSTSAITVDTVAPTINISTTNPNDGAPSVPISAFIHVGFSENLDQSTLLPSAGNVTFCSGVACGSGGTAVGAGVRAYPNGFDVVVSSKPTYAADSRFAKANAVATGFYMMSGSSAIAPQGAYTSPAVGDIVITQRETFPPELGLITTATLTSGVFAINGFPAFGGQQITKFATPTATGAVTAATAVTAGDIIVVNTTLKPTDVRYNWHIVTTGAAVNSMDLRLDSQDAAPTYVASSRFSTIAPTDTSAVNGTSQVVGSVNGGINFVVGDLVFAKITAGGDNLNSYAWHIVTTAENITTDALPNTLRLDGALVAPTFAVSSQISKLTPFAQGAVTDTATVFSFGDIVLAKTTANASNSNAYAFHMVTGGATGANSTGLRFDNFPGSLAPSTTYVVTAANGIKDVAGNSFAATSTITFTTGATGGTNITPPFVQSSQPQSGSQTFPSGTPIAPIKLTFSVDMINSGNGSVLTSANIGLFTDNFGAPGTVVAATNTYDAATRTVTITPSAALTASAAYIVKVFTTTTSATGTALSMPFFLSFRTGSGADSTRPTVMGVFPANASASASLSSIVTAGFSEDINAGTLTTTSVKLAPTADLTATVAGSVTYNPSSRSVSFSPSTQLTAGTAYTFTITTAAADLAGNTLLSNYTSAFTTTASADTVDPFVTFSNADNFSVAVTFSEPVKTGGGPNAADNIANYTVESPVGSTIGLGGKTVTYDAMTRTARITGLSLQNGATSTYKVTVSTLVQDLANRTMDTTDMPPPKNTSFGTVQNSTTTGGQIGPGSGTIDPGAQGMNPTRVTPMTRAAGATSSYKVEFLAATTIPATGQIVLTFPDGFNASGVGVATAGTASFCNSDINGPATGTVTFTVAGTAGGVVTITTVGAATGTNSFLCLDLTGIVNSSAPSSAGYTATIQTKTTAVLNRSTLETKTAAPFFLGALGSRTLTVNVFNDNGGTTGIANNNIKDGDESGINNVSVFLFSPASGGQSGATDASGVKTFTGLADGDYMIGLEPSTLSSGGFAFNSAPQPFTVSATSLTKNFGLRTSAINIQGNITGGPATTAMDVFASSSNGFASTTVTTDGAGAATYSLPVSANTTYRVGVGPAMPRTMMQPGAPPPPPPTFTFMPPPSLEVIVAGITVAGKNFALTTTDKTITGAVNDSTGTGVSNAGVFCRPVQSSTMGEASGFGTGGQTKTDGTFSIRVINGTYLCGVFKPGMPPVPDKQIVVATAGNTPTSLTFVLDAATTLSISGTVKDDSGNAIPYAGVSGRKVNSTSDTTAMGGDSSNFVGGPTDANGAYTLYVTAGTWVVEAFAPGFGQLGTKTITITASNSTGQDFSAQTMTFRTITGTATSSSSPVQGVMVRAQNSTGTSGNMSSSAADGTYTIKVPDGTYSVTCFFSNLGDSAAIGGSVSLSSSTTTAVRNCTAGTPITITVNVTDGANAITNAGIDIRDSAGRGNFTTTSTTVGINAVYVMTVPPGTYTVRVGHPAYGKIGETANVSSTQSINYTAASGAMVAVTGRVTGDGSNLAGAWASLIGTPTGATNTVFLGGQTIANGTFSVSVPPGSYRLRVDKPGYRSPAESTVTVTIAADVGTIALTTAARTISGTVTLSGSPVSNAFVDATDGAGGYAVAQTDANGAYSLAVDNGTWSLRAHSMGYDGGPLSVTVSSNSPSGQTITLTAISGFTIKPEKPETVTPTSGGFLTNTDIGSNFKLNIPANALGTGSNSATVTTKINTGMPNPPSGAILAKNAVTITAADSAGQPVKNLNSAATITVPYDEANLPAGSSESSLVIGVWNDATQTYDALATTVDTTANTLTATTTHFSDFAPMVSSGDSPPATPSGLSAANLGTGSTVNLTWTAVSGASTYDIYRSTDNATFPLLASTTSTSYVASGLSSSTTYYFKVSALSSNGSESAASSAVTIMPSIGGGGSSGSSSSSSSSSNSSTPATPATPAAPNVSPAAPTTPATSAAPATPAVSNVITPVAETLAVVYKISAPVLGKVLKVGQASGTAIKNLQKFLNERGFVIAKKGVGSPGKENTLLGTATKKQLKLWQASVGLKPTGKLDQATIDYLYPFVWQNNLKVNMASGRAIKNLQQYLNAHGFVIAKKGAGSPGKETTLLGVASKKQLKLWQVSVGLKPTGKLDKATIDYIKANL